MPILDTHIKSFGCDIRLWQLDEPSAMLYNMLLPYLTSREKTEYNNISNEKRRKEWAATRLLSIEMLGTHQSITYNSKGKPEIAGQAGISISHTNGMVALMTSSEKNNIGIDIEQKTQRITKISHKFLTEIELSGNLSNNLSYLYIQWCAKEAMYKAVNTDNYDYQNTYTLPGFQYNEEPSGKILGRITFLDGNTQHINVEYTTIGQYIMCMAIQN